MAVRLQIFARDPDRARAFYAHVFGWSLPKGQPCWVITTGHDPRLGVDGPADISADHGGTVAIPTVHVADLDATIAAALAAGGEILVPRIPLPGVGWLAYLADTEGNLIGLMQDDPGAAWPRTPTTQPPAGSSARLSEPGGAARVVDRDDRRGHEQPSTPRPATLT